MDGGQSVESAASIAGIGGVLLQILLRQWNCVVETVLQASVTTARGSHEVDSFQISLHTRQHGTDTHNAQNAIFESEFNVQANLPQVIAVP